MTPTDLVAVIGAVIPLIAALGVIYQQVRSTHTLVDGRMNQLLEQTKVAGTKEGEMVGRDFVPDPPPTGQPTPPAPGAP